MTNASAAERQDHDYQGVPTADLVILYRGLSRTPATLAVMAVLVRVRSELDRRNHHERNAACAHPDNRIPETGPKAETKVEPQSSYQRGDRVMVTFPVPGTSQEAAQPCYVEHVLVEGDLEVVRFDDEWENTHVVSPDRVVYHEPSVI